ncbi:MAG: biopolymer transporter ExbD [Polyangiaceae bacterium]
MTQSGPSFNDTAADAPLSPAQRSKIRRLAQPKDAEPGDEAGELNIVPYLDIVTNILVFVLATVSVTFLTELNTTPPSIGSGKVKQQLNTEALNLAVLIADDGVSFKTSFGSIRTGCDGTGRGPTVKVRGEKYDYDYEEIRRCARELKSRAGGGKFEEETQVTVTASRDVEFKYLVAVLDALRADPEGELFPEFHLGVAK